MSSPIFNILPHYEKPGVKLKLRLNKINFRARKKYFWRGGNNCWDYGTIGFGIFQRCKRTHTRFWTRTQNPVFWKIFKPRTRTRVWFFKNPVPEPEPEFKIFEIFCLNFWKPNLNPKPDFLEKFWTLNPNPNLELDFWKPGTQIRTRSNKFWKPSNRTSHYFLAGLHLWNFLEFHRIIWNYFWNYK